MLFKRQQGNLPSTSETNSRGGGNEHCKAIVLISGKELEAHEKTKRGS